MKLADVKREVAGGRGCSSMSRPRRKFAPELPDSPFASLLRRDSCLWTTVLSPKVLCVSFREA